MDIKRPLIKVDLLFTGNLKKPSYEILEQLSKGNSRARESKCFINGSQSAFELGIMPEMTRGLGLVSGQISPTFAGNSENITKLECLGDILEKEVASHNVSQVALCTLWFLGSSIQRVSSVP